MTATATAPRWRYRENAGVRVLSEQHPTTRCLLRARVFMDVDDEANACEEGTCGHTDPEDCAPYCARWEEIGCWSNGGKSTLSVSQASAFYNLVALQGAAVSPHAAPCKSERFYVSLRGELWTLSCDCPPIPDRSFDWSAVPDDHDGDGPVVYGGNIDGVVRAIEEHESEESE